MSLYKLCSGQDADDLPFKKGEILDVLTKDEEQWWTARNALGMTGQIPVPYVQKSIQPPAISVSIRCCSRNKHALVSIYN